MEIKCVLGGLLMASPFIILFIWILITDGFKMMLKVLGILLGFSIVAAVMACGFELLKGCL